MRLVLADGTQLEGAPFGASRAVRGEVVFNTAMSGYVEALTDPSYRGQILVLTYPLIGNYGVPDARPPGNIDPPYESSRIQVQGLIVQHYVDAFSHRAGRRSLAQWLEAEGIPAMTGVDTRALTRRLREHGTMEGVLQPDGPGSEVHADAVESVDMRRDVFMQVAPARALVYPGSGPTIMVIDVGAKDQIVRSLIARGACVHRVPWHADLSSHADRVHGIVIGNGPGDPADLSELVGKIRLLLTSFSGPIFGVCLGNQLLALAAGASTYKLPYGHRGVNQPVHDLITRRSFITSQNHGYAVLDSSLPPGWEPWFVNINDGSNEGVRSRTRPHFGVQFHPEAKPGPEDTGFLFDDFLRVARAA